MKLFLNKHISGTKIDKSCTILSQEQNTGTEVRGRRPVPVHVHPCMAEWAEALPEPCVAEAQLRGSSHQWPERMHADTNPAPTAAMMDPLPCRASMLN
jgi:hypothetical protein